VGVGAPLAPPVLRLMLALKAASLGRGYSGVRPVVIDTLLAVHNAGLVPWIPAQGSVGASGDLAPLSHMTLALMGEGEFNVDGDRVPAIEVLAAHGIVPLALQAKEGLALINGTQTSTALALHALLSFEPVLESATHDRCADGGRGARQRRPLRPAYPCAARPAGADRRRPVLPAAAGWQRIRASHSENDDRVQDPYCLRCQPQVVGAALDQLRHAALVLVREANAVTDNPLVFPDDGAALQDRAPGGLGGVILSGGNFHAEPVALAADAMACAIAEVGAISRAPHRDADRQQCLAPAALPDRRRRAQQRLHDRPRHRRVLASENKSLAHPASVDSLPTSANQEDHVSMATFAARRLQPMIANVAHILGIEWLAAAQGIEFLRPLTSSAALEQAFALLRARCPSVDVDRHLAPDLEAAAALVHAGVLSPLLRALPEVPALWVPA
jgi:histidine ammonia-lyase